MLAAAKSAAKPAAKPAAKSPEKPAEAMTAQAREAMFQAFAQANPEPKGELDSKDAFTLLVAVVLSAQSTDKGVNKVTKVLFAEADTPAKLAALGEAAIRERIQTLGLYRNKAKHLAALARIIVEQHGGETPREREALEALPGVGRKSANVVLNLAFGEPTMAVDTHVFRVARRTGLSAGATPLAVEQDLVARIPEVYAHRAHHWLVLHGRYVCKARKPACGECLVRATCNWPERTSPRT